MTTEQESPDTPLSAQDFYASGWESVIQQDPAADYMAMHQLLSDAATRSNATAAAKDE